MGDTGDRGTVTQVTVTGAGDRGRVTPVTWVPEVTWVTQ